MTRRLVVLTLTIAAALAGLAAPALADDDGTRVCVILSNDRNNPGPSPLCVWVPVAN